MKLLKLACLLALSCAANPAIAADAPVATAPAPITLVPNGGFENGIVGWTIFVPDESKDKNCRFDVVSDTPHSGVNCVRLQTDGFARFCIGSAIIPVQPGERYHVSVWVRADPAAQFRTDVPAGFVVRLALRQGNADAAGGHIFIGSGNRVSRNTPPDPAWQPPTKWTQIESVIEIPTGVDAIVPALFSWWTQGTVFADDFSIEKVDASTPVTPLWQKTPGSAAAPK